MSRQCVTIRGNAMRGGRRVGLGAALGLAGCLASGLPSPGEAHPADPCRDLVTWPLYVHSLPGEPLAAYFRANEEAARAFIESKDREAVTIPAGALRRDPPVPADDVTLAGLGIDIGFQELGRILVQLDTEPTLDPGPLPEALIGLAGFSTAIFLQKVLPLDDEDPIADRIVMGRIRDYTFVENPAAGYKGGGHLAVDICTDVLEFVEVGQDRRIFYHWDIEVGDNGFDVWVRSEPTSATKPADYSDPFPGVGVVLPDFSADPADPRSVWRRGLDHKLHAAGLVVKITDIYARPLETSTLKRLEDEHDWYEPTEASCVDVFTEGRPPGTFAELASGGYCLGRCLHPPIVNSGE